MSSATLGADVTRKDLAELLDLAADRAPALRKAGVRRFAHGDLEIELDTYEAPADDSDQKPQPRFGVLEDPATFGIEDPEAQPPGRRRREAR